MDNLAEIESEYEEQPDNNTPVIPDYPLPEAGGIAWTDVYSKTGSKINLTARATNLIKAATELRQAVQFVTKEFGWLATPPTHGNPPPRSEPKPAVVATVTPTPVPTPVAPAPAVLPAPATPAPAATPPQTVGGGTVHATRMDVTPRADGKTKLEFFATGHQYADVSVIRAPEQLIELLAAVTSTNVDFFKQPNKYSVNYLIDWKPSTKLKQSGKPYEDIVAVRPGG